MTSAAAPIASSIFSCRCSGVKRALPALVQQKEGHKKRLQTFRPTTKVTVNNEISNQATVVEVEGLDRPGLLSALTRTISALNLDIASAHITTYGERVVDAFYVTDLTGAKISNPARKDIIADRLMEVLKGKSKERPTAPQS